MNSYILHGVRSMSSLSFRANSLSSTGHPANHWHRAALFSIVCLPLGRVLANEAKYVPISSSELKDFLPMALSASLQRHCQCDEAALLRTFIAAAPYGKFLDLFIIGSH